MYIAELMQTQPGIDEAEVDTKLDQEFAFWFEIYVSKLLHTIILYSNKLLLKNKLFWKYVISTYSFL